MLNKIEKLQEKGLFTFYKQQEQSLLPSKYLDKQKQISYCDENIKNKSQNRITSRNYPDRLTSSKQMQTQDRNVSLNPQRRKKSQKNTIVNKNSKKNAVKGQTSFRQIQIVNKDQFKKRQNMNQQSQKKINRIVHFSHQKNKQNPQIKIKILSQISEKKTNISQIKIQLKPFQKNCHSENWQQQYSNLFLKQDQKVEGNFINQTNYDKNEPNLQKCAQNSTNILKGNKNLSQNFLSNIIRRNVRMISIRNKSITRKINLKESSTQKDESLFSTRQNPQNKQIFKQQNDRTSSFIDLGKSHEHHSNQKQSRISRTEQKRLKSQIINMKTKSIHPTNNLVTNDQSNKNLSQFRISLQNSHTKQDKYNIISQECSQKIDFLTDHKQSIKIYDMLQKQSKEIFGPFNVHQYYKKFKTSSKKILKLSPVKNISTENYNNSNNGLAGKALKAKHNSFSDQKINSQAIQKQNRQKQAVKFPFISNYISLKQKKSSKLGRLPDKIKDFELKPLHYNKVSKRRKMNTFFNGHENKQQAKKLFRSHTDECKDDQKPHRQSLKWVIQTLSRIQLRQKQFLCIKKSLSSKIIKSFHQQQNKRNQPQQHQSNIISMLDDMIENSLIHSKQSLDWQHRKRQIIKRLDVNINV